MLKITTRRAALIVTLSILLSGSGIYADNPDPLPPGMAQYAIILWEPGTPIPGDPERKPMEKVDEPDLEKLGGKLLFQRQNRRIALLPRSAVQQLWHHQAVASVQRIWNGESLHDWNEPEPESADSRFDIETDSELQWGPKSYAYDGSGNITDIGSDSYVYDGVGRLVQSTVNGKTESYTYDAFGNMTQKTLTGSTPVNYPVDEASNRIIGQQYDAAGNLITRNGAEAYTYDSLGMMSRYSSQIVDRRMIYDAHDERIGTLLDSSSSRWTIRDLDGQILREYKSDDMQWTMIWYWNQDHIRGEGQLVAGEALRFSYNAQTQTYRYGGKRHYHLDHLGSVRMVTDNDHRSISEHEYFPFGATQTRTFQEQINWGDPHVDGMRFADHWRDFLGYLDVEGNDYLDYMHARYYDPHLARFLSVDPVLDIKQALKNPQGWNRYTYTLNNPVRYTDPTGKVVFSAEAVAEQIKERDLQQKQIALETYARQLATQVNSGAIDSKTAMNLYWTKALHLTKPSTPKGTPTRETLKTAKENALLIATGAALNFGVVRGSSVAVGDTITGGSLGADTLHHFFINAINTYDGMPARFQRFGANQLRGEDDARDVNANSYGATFGDLLQRKPHAMPSDVIP